MKRHVRIAVTSSAAFALLLSACSGGPDLSTHAGLHEFAGDACVELRAAAPGSEAAGALAGVIKRAIDAGATEESLRDILTEECAGTLAAIDAAG